MTKIFLSFLLLFAVISTSEVSIKTGKHRVLAFPAFQESDDFNWHLQKDESGIKVYLRKLRDSKAREFKVTSTMETSLNAAIALIKDDKAGLDWIQRATVFKTLKVINEKQWVTYSELSIPWPFENRDLITKNTISQDSITKTVFISLHSQPEFIQEKTGITRVKKSEGSWVFKPAEDGQIEATYTIYSEQAKTFIPLGIITPIIVNGLHKSVERFKNLSSKEKYRTAHIPFIR